MSDITQLAANKARIKRSILGMLAELPDESAQADVLADLTLMVAAGEVEDSPEKVTKKKSNATKTVKTKTAPPRKGGKASKGLRPGTKATAVYNALKAHPRMALKELAKTVYGTESATRALRAVLFSLKRQGLVKNEVYGKWEVSGP